MKIELRNNFHNTLVILHMKGAYPTVAQIKRARKELCGIKGCSCGNVLGERGPQTVIIGESQEYLNGNLIPSIRPRFI